MGAKSLRFFELPFHSSCGSEQPGNLFFWSVVKEIDLEHATAVDTFNKSMGGVAGGGWGSR